MGKAKCICGEHHSKQALAGANRIMALRELTTCSIASVIDAAAPGIMGARGGSKTSAAKSEASRRNAMKRWHPDKT